MDYTRQSNASWRRGINSGSRRGTSHIRTLAQLGYLTVFALNMNKWGFLSGVICMETKYPKKYYLSKRYTLKDILKSFSGNLKTVGTGYLIFPLVRVWLQLPSFMFAAISSPLHVLKRAFNHSFLICAPSRNRSAICAKPFRETECNRQYFFFTNSWRQIKKHESWSM